MTSEPSIYLLQTENQTAAPAPPRQRYLRRMQAAAYVRDHWGIPCAASFLAKLAVVGGGPLFRKAGRHPIYAMDELDRWADSRIGRPLRSTAEFAAGGSQP